MRTKIKLQVMQGLGQHACNHKVIFTLKSWQGKTKQKG